MPKQGASLSSPDIPPSPGPAGVAGRTQRRGFHKNRRSNSKKRFSRDHRQLTDEIQKKRFCRTSCSCQTKREVRDFTGPAVITGQNSKERGFVHNQLKLLDKTQRTGSYRTGWSCQIKLKEEVLTGLVGLVGRNKRWTYNTSWSCRDATQKEEVLKM